MTIEYISDMVNVVRCKDCQYYIDNSEHPEITCHVWDNPDFYCAAGKRKNSEQPYLKGGNKNEH